jgi:hypothetical protein
MTWPLFAVVQLVLTTVGVALVLSLRNRELVRKLEAQEAATRDAAVLLEDAASRFQSVADETLASWLAERATEFDEHDPVQVVQKLVLQNEQEAIPDFADSMRRRISAGTEARKQTQEQWRQLRMDSYEQASGLIERFPRSHPVIVQIYDVFCSLDAEHEVELPALPDPVENPDAEAFGSEETEHLRAANELLRAQLEETQNDMVGLRTRNEEQQRQEDDLKALLQQFTRDSRDMMACIGELERENQRLRDQNVASSAESGGRARTDDAA